MLIKILKWTEEPIYNILKSFLSVLHIKNLLTHWERGYQFNWLGLTVNQYRENENKKITEKFLFILVIFINIVSTFNRWLSGVIPQMRFSVFFHSFYFIFVSLVLLKLFNLTIYERWIVEKKRNKNQENCFQWKTAWKIFTFSCKALIGIIVKWCKI